MSFSGRVKEELVGQIGTPRHCQIAELASLFCFCGKIEVDPMHHIKVRFHAENDRVIRKCFTLIKKTFNINTCILGQGPFSLEISGEEEIKRLLQTMKIMDANSGTLQRTDIVNPLLLKSTCCRRAFLRGAYMVVGSMSDPEKSYHLEFVCDTVQAAQQLREVMAGFDLEAKMIERKGRQVVYIKEGTAIVDLLNIMEAHVSLMSLENLRIVKEVRNSVNRRVNCEAANIRKTVNASSKQIEDITLLRDRIGLKNLPDSLREMAEVRLEYPEATLSELGTYLEPPVGKSGVNHRLRKLSELAEEIR
ncbi:MAG: DNA-binding protein WhiA [Lachnospiraceae bacterium]|nr:DNA-binding protein WhiA [Lachnospiraceae bacterium]